MARSLFAPLPQPANIPSAEAVARIHEHSRDLLERRARASFSGNLNKALLLTEELIENFVDLHGGVRSETWQHLADEYTARCLSGYTEQADRLQGLVFEKYGFLTRGFTDRYYDSDEYGLEAAPLSA